MTKDQRTMPIYGEIASLVNQQPNVIDDIATEDLLPVFKLNLLDPEPKRRLLIKMLNVNHRMATDLTTEELWSILVWSDEAYYNSAGAPMLKDQVYDYVKRVHGQRVKCTMDKEKTMLSVSSETGVGIKPTKGRDARLPVPLRSLDNLFNGEGDVDKWSNGHKGPYVLSAKMDGTSALYHNGMLFTRGDATVGRNISHILHYLSLPKMPTNIAVRGELVIDRYLFERKYKDKPASNGSIRKINRNSVAGALGSINNMDEGFFKDLTFVAYEIIDIVAGSQQLRPAEQFRKLLLDGFSVAKFRVLETVSDQILSAMYHDLIATYNYEVDGVVIQTDYPYVRETEKNPEYAKSYKEALTQDVAVTKIITIEWNVSQYGYFVPTIIYEPVSIGGVTLQRATAHNAREVQKLGLGPGAIIEIVYRAKVNPQVNRVIQTVEPCMPKVPYKWIPSDSAGEPVNIVFDESAVQDETAPGETSPGQIIEIKRIHKFLVEIGAKGMGETTVEKIYHKAGYKTVGDFIGVKLSDVSFLGKQAGQNIVKSIETSIKAIDLPTLMASSKVFGRGLGTKKFTKVFTEYPDFASKRHSYEEYVRMFLKVDGFADKTATLAAKGMVDFWEFIDTQLSADIYKRIIDNTAGAPVEPVAVQAPSWCTGKNIYLTGGKNQEIIDIIKRNGGNIQSTFNASTDILIRRDASYTNKKTEEAEQRGIQILNMSDI
jgi:NAD-dependent DNA ligase